MCTFSVAMDGGICFMNSTVRLVHVAKWTFLMYFRRVLRTGLNSVTWHHCDNSVFVISARALSAADRGGIGGRPGMLVRLTCHTPDVFYQVTYNTVSPYFTTFRLVVVRLP